ncbi:MAG: hypothetical protein AAF609_20805 [Cyanobacteria bacterium P01_C01_bin.120]
MQEPNILFSSVAFQPAGDILTIRQGNAVAIAGVFMPSPKPRPGNRAIEVFQRDPLPPVGNDFDGFTIDFTSFPLGVTSLLWASVVYAIARTFILIA